MAEPVIPDFGEASDCVTDNRLFCPDWVRENWDPVLQPALVQHIYLTAIAVGVGFVISVGAALLAHRLSHVERPFAFLAAVIYTIPASSPLYYVTYVKIYEVTPTTVSVGYTPGYTGTVVTTEQVCSHGASGPCALSRHVDHTPATARGSPVVRRLISLLNCFSTFVFSLLGRLWTYASDATVITPS